MFVFSLSLSLPPSPRDLLDQLAHEERLVKRENKVLEVTKEKTEKLVLLVIREPLDNPVRQVVPDQKDYRYACLRGLG